MKKIGLIFITLFLMFTLLGCSNTQDKETLTIGLECAYPPFNWAQDEENEFTMPISNNEGMHADGYDIAVAKKIAEELDYNVVIKQLEWDALIPSLKAKQIDLIIAGMSPTEERKKEIDFTDSYYRTTHVVMLKKDSPYINATSRDDFAGAVGVGQAGTLYDGLIDQLPGVTHATPIDSMGVITTNIKSGKADLTVIEKPVAESIVRSNSDLTYITLDEPFDVAEEDVIVSIGLRQGELDLKAEVNSVLNNISSEERDQMMVDAVLRSEGVSTDSNTFFGKIIYIAKTYSVQFLSGIGYTLLLSLSGTLFGLILSFIIALLRMQNVNKKDLKPIKALKYLALGFGKLYVTVFRGTPMIVQAMIIYYGLAFGGININPLAAGLITVTLNTTAYLAEVLRGGIQSVDNGQVEACRSLGFNQIQTFFYVVLPQAVKKSFPSIGNEFIINIKDTSVLNIIQVTELFFFANLAGQTTYSYFEAMLLTGAIYLVLTLVTSKILQIIEKKMNMPVKSLTSSN